MSKETNQANQAYIIQLETKLRAKDQVIAVYKKDLVRLTAIVNEKNEEITTCRDKIVELAGRIKRYESSDSVLVALLEENSALNEAVVLLKDISEFWAYGMSQPGEPTGYDEKYAARLGERTAEVLDKAKAVRR